MTKDCKKHYSDMYEVRMGMSVCPFCTIQSFTEEVAKFKHAAETCNEAYEQAETRVKELETLLKSHPHPYFAHHVAEALKEKTP